MAEKRWIPETLFDELGLRMTYEVERVLYEMRTEHQHLVLFQHRGQGEDVADVVIDDQHPLAGQHLVRLVQSLQHLPWPPATNPL